MKQIVKYLFVLVAVMCSESAFAQAGTPSYQGYYDYYFTGWSSNSNINGNNYNLSPWGWLYCRVDVSAVNGFSIINGRGMYFSSGNDWSNYEHIGAYAYFSPNSRNTGSSSNFGYYGYYLKGIGYHVTNVCCSGTRGTDYLDAFINNSWWPYGGYTRDFTFSSSYSYYGIRCARSSSVNHYENFDVNYVRMYFDCPDVYFNETSTNAYTTSWPHQSDYSVDLYVTINMPANQWHLFCPPCEKFSKNSYLGSDAEVYKFSSVSGQRIVLSKYTGSTLDRNTVYLVKPTKAISGQINPCYMRIFTKNYEYSQGANSYTLKGTYCKKDLSSLSNVFYFKNDMADARNIKGMRGYFTFPAGVANARDIPWVVEDAMGNTTAIKGIDEIREQLVVKSSPYANNIYDINGQQQSSNLQQLRRGIYIRNGKKFFRQ